MTGLPGTRRAAARRSAAATADPAAAPSSETGDGDAPAVSLTTPPRDQGQRRRAEKTTVRPPADPLGVESGA
jgi:hypothetical protein